jgi:hypothetical protein
MAIQEKQLGQSRPSGTTAESIYSPGTSVTAIIKNIVICNTSTSSAKFSIYIDDDGSTYSENTAMSFEQAIAGKTTVVPFEGFFPMNNENGNIAVQTDVANALTFTVSGAEITV